MPWPRAPHPFEELDAFGYQLIMADPPWQYRLRSHWGERKSYAHHYGAMSFEQIAALPVGQLAAPNAVLFLWCTWPLLLYGGDSDQHFAGADASRSRVGEVMRAWGFRYVTGGAWLKRKSKGGIAFGTGYRARSACEPFLLGVAGEPATSRSERNFIDGLAREHSRKPEEAFAWCERYMPHARRVELFSRQTRPRWDTWGYERGKFDPVVAHNAPPVREVLASSVEYSSSVPGGVARSGAVASAEGGVALAVVSVREPSGVPP